MEMKDGVEDEVESFSQGFESRMELKINNV